MWVCELKTVSVCVSCKLQYIMTFHIRFSHGEERNEGVLEEEEGSSSEKVSLVSEEKKR